MAMYYNEEKCCWLSGELNRLFNDVVNPALTAESKDDQASVWEEFSQNGKDSEYCPELTWPTSLLSTLAEPKHVKQRKKAIKQGADRPKHCVFCKNNGEDASFYQNHILKERNGRILCPVLRAYTCPICKATGDNAHTIKYCPQNKSGDFVSMGALKTTRTAAGRIRKSF